MAPIANLPLIVTVSVPPALSVLAPDPEEYDKVATMAVPGPVNEVVAGSVKV